MDTERRILIANIRIWTAVFAAVLFCIAFSFVAFADGEPAAIAEGDKIVIGTTEYPITDTATLVAADLALLEWYAKGTAMKDVGLSGEFDDVPYTDFATIYGKIYDRLLSNAEKTISGEITSSTAVGSGSGARIFKIEKDTVVTLSTYMEVYHTGKIVVVSEGNATIKLSYTDNSNYGRFLLGMTFNANASDKCAIVVQGRSADSRISIEGDEHNRDIRPACFLYGGSMYLHNAVIENFNFGSSEDGSAVIYVPSASHSDGKPVNNRRNLYMTNTLMQHISGGKSPGIFIKAFNASGGESANKENALSEFYLYNSKFSDCVTKGGSNYAGGPVIRSFAADNTKLRVESCLFVGNCNESSDKTSGGGAIYWKSAAGSAQIIDCVFEDNSSQGVGGAIYNTGNMTIENCRFVNNTAEKGGGAIAAEPPRTGNYFGNIATNKLKGSLTLDKNTVLSGNKSGLDGGAIYFNAVIGDNGAIEQTPIFITKYQMELHINGATIESNTASRNGGAIAMALAYGDYNYTTGITIAEDSTITNNTAAGDGGAIWMGSDESCECIGNQGVTMESGTLQGNKAVNGGAAYVQGGNFVMLGGTLDKNTADSDGGGVYVNATRETDGVSVSGGTISGNTATQNGGGVAVHNGTYKMIGGNVVGNTATLGNGGGIYVSADTVDVVVDILSGTVSNNKAGTSGGALAVEGPKTGEREIRVTIGVNQIHDCDHDRDPENGVRVEECPVLVGNFASKNGGGVYITGGEETHLNTYCMTEEENYAADDDDDPKTHNSKSNFMMVEGGTVIVSTADPAQADPDKKGDDHGKIVINNTIHVFAGHVDLYGSIENPLILGNMTVDVPDERGSFEDHRTRKKMDAGGVYFTVQYCENYYDLDLKMVTGQYTVILVEANTEHTILPTLYEHDGYMIDGWWTEQLAEGGVDGDEYIPGIKVTMTDDLTLYAKWLPVGYYVYFEIGDIGELSHRGEMEKQRCNTDKEFNLPANKFFVEGMTFAGWDKNGDKVADYEDQQTGLSNLTTERGITLVALWVECTHESEYFTVSKLSDNVLERICVCEACTQTATLTAEDSVYTPGVENKAKLKITGGATNKKSAPEWDLEVSHTGKKYPVEVDGQLVSQGAPAKKNIDAGIYTASIEDGGETACVTFEIKKADRPNPTKPTYKTHATDASVDDGKIVIEIPSDTSLTGYLKYRIDWYNDGGVLAFDTLDYGDATTTGFNLNTTYTNYYVYAMYEGDDNHNPSEWVKADAVLFYKGKVYIHITTDSGMDYETHALDGDRGLAIVVKALNGNYLYNTVVTDDNDKAAIARVGNADLAVQTFNMTDIPESTEETLSINVTITGVRKKVVITSTVEQSEVFGQVKSNQATITRDSAYTAYFDIKNYHDVYAQPQLRFSCQLPEGATVILVDKSSGVPVYYSYRASGVESVIPLYGTGGFVQMGTQNTVFSVPAGSADNVAYFDLKYQVIVDFSDCTNVIGEIVQNLDTSFIAVSDPANTPELTDNEVSVTLTDVTAASMSIAPGGTRQTVTVTVPEGSAASSKWLGTSAALVLEPRNSIPVDAYIEARDFAGNRKPYYQNSDGEFVIPLDSGGRQEVTLSLVSNMFDTVEATKHVFNISLISVPSAVSGSVGNGTVMAAIAEGIVFDEPEKTEQPAVSITSEMSICEYGKDVCITVNAVGIKTTGQDATNGDTNIDVLDYKLTLRLYNKKVDDSGKESYVDSGWKPNEDKAQLGKNTVPLGTLTGSCCIVAQLIDSENNVVADDTYYFVIVK